MPAFKQIRPFRASDLIRQLLLAWLAAITAEYLCLPPTMKSLSDTGGTALIVCSRAVITTLLLTSLLWVLSRFWNTRTIERWGMVALFALLSGTAIGADNFSMPLTVVCLLLLAVLILFAIRGWNGTAEHPSIPQTSSRVHLRLTAALALAFFLFVSIWTVCRVYSFSTPTYDFGIFAQMFHYMKTTGLPMTTLERDGLLSHFHVHMSPIYYLLLPFYCLFPHPATLQILQAAVITSAVIPLWRLGEHHGLSGGQRVLLCALLLLSPAFSGGTSYDIHENCFLTPLILWLFCGIDQKNTAMTAVSSLLILTVKEDAAVYVAVIALWLTVRSLLRRQKRELITGIAMFAVSLTYFLLVTGYLAQIGDGVMTGRYQNFMYGGSASLLTVVATVLLNPMKAVYECVDSEKLSFIALTLLPLLGLPLLTRRYERYILLIPYILVNLMPDYVYQHDIFFQYTFGSTACLFYLTAVNLADLKQSRLRTSTLAAAVIAATLSFGMTVLPKAISYPKQYIRQAEQYQSICETLSAIPDGASVTANTFYTTFLSRRDILYDLGYASKKHILETEFVVINLSTTSELQKFASPGQKNGYGKLLQLLLQNGYTEYAALDNILVIFRKTT